jgi:penicillin amidase
MKIALRLLLAAGLLVVSALLVAFGGLRASLPKLDGDQAVSGLSGPVRIIRDAQGVPTITAPDRLSLSMALGFIHGQERFFQMDLARRAGAGELAQLVGPAIVSVDEDHRRFRMRARAEAAFARASQADRDMAEAYAKGVNAGLNALTVKPFEYFVLAQTPAPWKPEDSYLINVAMFFNLQSGLGWDEIRRSVASAKLGPEMARFLYPETSEFDAAIDGSQLPLAPMPDGLPVKASALTPDHFQAELPIAGSNNWAVSGALAGRTGSAMLANDMHLGHSVPNIWYRARLIQQQGTDAPTMDMIGVTLPGTFGVLVGSNGHVAWGFTNSQIDTGDVVILEPVGDDHDQYQTKDGPRTLAKFEERLCEAKSCPVLTVEESQWGPVIGTDAQGRKLAYRWLGQDLDYSIGTTLLAFENMRSVAEAIDAAHHAFIPNQNFVVADDKGHIGWTIAGRVPKRVGFDGREPTSWADGSRYWDGQVAQDDIPTLIDPPNGRIWTANSRIIGGPGYEILGGSGYALGIRAQEIRDDLLAKDHFLESDLLAIQLDIRAPIMNFWREHLLVALKSRTDDTATPALINAIDHWTGSAEVTSVGYRLIRTYRANVISRIYAGYTKELAAASDQKRKNQWLSNQGESVARRLLTEQPPKLVPAGYANWGEVIDGAVSDLKADIAKSASGDVSKYSWGAQNRSSIHHPLALAIPALSVFLDPPVDPLPGDTNTVRVASPSHGASERLVVSPGHEDTGLYHMPSGQSGHPLSPYYNLGHQDWVRGTPSPLLPAAPRWTLNLVPGKG